jgi:Fur family peroxide stress response transcriptional regulator
MNYVTLLKDKNLKATPQRLTIVEELYINGHMNIDQLYKTLLKKFPSISLATIYKNVNAMIDICFLSEVKIPNNKSVYELTKAEHSHVVCSVCGSVSDITLDLTNLCNQAKQKSDYTLSTSDIVFSGVCPSCNKNT